MQSNIKHIKLSEVADVIDSLHQTPKYCNKGIPMVRVTDVRAGDLDLTNCLMVSAEDYEKYSVKHKPQIGDIIISRVGSYGIISYVASSKAFCLGQNTAIISPKINSRYLYYVLSSYFVRQQIEQMVVGSTQKTISLKNIKDLQIPLFDEKEQDKIAQILESIDKKIAVNKQINDNLYEMVNAYYTSLFKDVECEMTTIGNYAERIYSGGTPTTSNAAYWDGAFGWFSSGETRNRFVISTEKTITQAGIDNSSTKLAAKHDIVMASAGQGFTRGQTSMLLIDTYVNQSVIVIHTERKVLPYLFWNLANRYEELRAISDSSSIRGSLTTKMIAAFEIPLANEESLQAFADFSWSVIPQIENNLLENERLAALRDTLLPKLMSGEIDVSNIQL